MCRVRYIGIQWSCQQPHENSWLPPPNTTVTADDVRKLHCDTRERVPGCWRGPWVVMHDQCTSFGPECNHPVTMMSCRNPSGNKSAFLYFLRDEEYPTHEQLLALPLGYLLQVMTIICAKQPEIDYVGIGSALIKIYEQWCFYNVTDFRFYDKVRDYPAKNTAATIFNKIASPVDLIWAFMNYTFEITSHNLQPRAKPVIYQTGLASDNWAFSPNTTMVTLTGVFSKYRAQWSDRDNCFLSFDFYEGQSVVELPTECINLTANDLNNAQTLFHVVSGERFTFNCDVGRTTLSACEVIVINSPRPFDDLIDCEYPYIKNIMHHIVQYRIYYAPECYLLFTEHANYVAAEARLRALRTEHNCPHLDHLSNDHRTFTPQIMDYIRAVNSEYLPQGVVRVMPILTSGFSHLDVGDCDSHGVFVAPDVDAPHTKRYKAAEMLLVAYQTFCQRYSQEDTETGRQNVLMGASLVLPSLCGIPETNPLIKLWEKVIKSQPIELTPQLRTILLNGYTEPSELIYGLLILGHDAQDTLRHAHKTKNN